MAFTKEDWFKIGRDLAFAGVSITSAADSSAAPREGSWQRKAWDAGFKAGKSSRTQARIPVRVTGLKVLRVMGPLYPPRSRPKTQRHGIPA